MKIILRLKRIRNPVSHREEKKEQRKLIINIPKMVYISKLFMDKVKID